MSSADGAGAIMFKGLGSVLSASKQGMAALSGGLNKVRKQYATKHEADVIAELKKKGVRPSEIMFQSSMSDEALRFGDFQKNSILQGLQEYINMSRVGKEHYDRDTMVHEFYYAILLCSEEIGDDWQQFEGLCKEAVRRVVTMGSAEDSNHEMQHKSAKAMFTFASVIKIAAQQEEQRRNKSLRDAEALIQREQEKRAKALAA